MPLDEKKYIIVPLLEELRYYNDVIGSYYKSTVTESYDYLVKLSNGKIILPMALVEDYENNRNAILIGRYRQTASGFTPYERSRRPKFNDRSEKKSNKFLPKILMAVGIIVMIIAFMILVVIKNRTK